MNNITQSSVSVRVEQVEAALNIFQDVSPRERRLGQILGDIVEAATSTPQRGQPHRSALRCSHHHAGSRCVGYHTLVCTEVPNRVAWSCGACGIEGQVLNALGSRWDLGGPDPGAIAIRLSDAEHRTLASLDAMSEDRLRAVSRSGRWVAEAVEVMGTPATLRRLVEAIEAEAGITRSPLRVGRLRRLADGLCEGLLEHSASR